MPYRIDLETPWTHDLAGRRLPRSETRATLEGAEKRACALLARLSAREPSRTYLHLSDVLMLDAGPQAAAFIHKDA
jgi:hypothetical protein